MEVTRLRAENFIDPDTEAYYRIDNQIHTVPAHCHEFFEIFLITLGKVIHCVNGHHQPLTAGSLVFTRPDDSHFFEKDGCEENQLINLAFPKKTIDDMLDYLGRDFLPNSFLTTDIPPVVLLSNTEREIVKLKFVNLTTIPYSHKYQIKTELRILLIELFTRYFSICSYKKRDIPSWLEHLEYEMKKIENLRTGLSALKKLSGKSPEYLCRVFKQYFHKTPTEFVNELRLNYAANLLTHSNEDIIAISMEAGFENLSHFYHMFKKSFNLSPSQFRKANQKKYG